MASSDIDQKYLAHIASITSATHPLLAAPFYSLLGLSSMLSARVTKAKKMRRLDLSRDTPSLIHYQHIIWLVREGLEILETEVLPHTMNGKFGAEATVLAAKLRASFYHLLSLFHNDPPVSQVPPPRSSSRVETASGVLGVSHRHNNSKSSIVSEKFSPKANQSKSKNGNTGRTPTLREPVASATSDASFITNPYASNRQGSAVSSPAPPPGLGGPSIAPRPSAFLFPPMNFLPVTESHFVNADRAATALLPGSHPLRLSTAVEHCAFVWDCLHDFQYARRHARQTIRAVYHAKEGMDDEDFEEAAKMVDQLGKIMKRRSWDGAVRPAGEGIPEQIQEEITQSQMGPLAQDVSIGEGATAQSTPPSMEQRPLTMREREIIKAGGSRGEMHLEDYLRKHDVFQLVRRFKIRLPMMTQVPNENRAYKILNRMLLPQRGPERVDGRPEGPVHRLHQVNNKLDATDWSRYEAESFRMRTTEDAALEPLTPSLPPHRPSPHIYSPPPAYTSPRPRRLRQRPAPIDVGLANRNVKNLPQATCPSPAHCGPCLPPLDLNKPLPPTPCSSASSAASPPPRPRPAPIDVHKANEIAYPRCLHTPPVDAEKSNEASKSKVIDEYEWSPRICRNKHFMIRNKRGLARYRNEAFPPIDGSRPNGNPVLMLLPTSIQWRTGAFQIMDQYRWVQPVTVLDSETYEAAIKQRDEGLIEKANEEAKKEHEYQAAVGKQKFEKLKAQLEWKMAQEAQVNAQQQQRT